MFLFPNPVGDGSPIHLKTGDNHSIDYNASIVSIEGRTILTAQGKIENIENEINKRLGNIQPGTYILSLKEENGEVNRVKFVKE